MPPYYATLPGLNMSGSAPPGVLFKGPGKNSLASKKEVLRFSVGEWNEKGSPLILVEKYYFGN